MNIHEIARRSGASLTLLRKLDALGVLKLDKEDDRVPAIRLHLARNPRLTTWQFIALLEEPYLVEDLGAYAKRAREQIAALGDVEGTKPAAQVATAVMEAARGDPHALAILADWVREAMPPIDVPFHWFAVRLAIASYPQFRESVQNSANLAFAKLRALPELAGWWRKEGSTIIYRRPLDL